MNPSVDIITEFIKNEKFKYLTILGLFYWRLTQEPIRIYELFDQFMDDYRSIVVKDEGEFKERAID